MSKILSADYKVANRAVLSALVADIDVPDDRARQLDEDWVAALAAILQTEVLQHPIRLRLVDNRLRLVTGLHRLEAFRLNGEQEIPYTLSQAASDDEARMEEVMENLARQDLKALDRCHHLYELKQVYERLYPTAKRGGDRGNQHTGGKRQILPFANDDQPAPEVFGFSIAVAEKVGLSERAIRIAVAIWKGLSVASRARCAETWLAGHQGNLKLLSEQTPAIQIKVLDLMTGDEPKASSVSDALAIIENGRLPNHVEKKFESLNRAITKLLDDELETAFAPHTDRIVKWLQRTGRI